eukprot:scaffold19679_cov124-Isochrysis_galbana.AAC.3
MTTRRLTTYSQTRFGAEATAHATAHRPTSAPASQRPRVGRAEAQPRRNSIAHPEKGALPRFQQQQQQTPDSRKKKSLGQPQKFKPGQLHCRPGALPQHSCRRLHPRSAPPANPARPI